MDILRPFLATTRIVLLLSLLLLTTASLLLLKGFETLLRLPSASCLGRRIPILHWFLKMFALILGLQIITRDTSPNRNSPKVRQLNRRALFVANHVSWMDIVALGATYKMNFIAKRELADYPILGAIARLFGLIFVNRSSLEDKIRCLNQTQQQLVHHSVCIFPEGTTSNGFIPSRELWQSGVFLASIRAKTLVRCVGISWGANLERVAWIDDMTLLPHLWQQLGVWSTTVQLATNSISCERSSRIQAEQAYENVSKLCVEASRLTESHHSSTLVIVEEV